MISMPSAYKQSMSNKFRNRSYLLCTVGVINQVAQKDSAFIETVSSKYSYLSNLEMPINNYTVELEYVSLENDWFKCDGNMLFPPRNREFLYNQGMVTKNCLGSCTIKFGNRYDIRGLTIDFGRNYPIKFSISNGVTTQYIYDNNKSLFTTDCIFNGTETITIAPTMMRSGNERMRIKTILMGVGISFENKNIISSSQSEHLSPIVDELPSIDFSLKVENYNRMFDVENSESAIHYLENGQDVTVKYGYDVNNDGNITWIDGCVVKLSDWQADDESMSFVAKDILSTMDDVYYNGKYREEGISLYDLAVDVLTDAGFEPREYELDDYLETVIVNNPMPCVSHREALQIIANAGRCKLFVNRQGLISIKSAFLTVISPDRMTVESDSATNFSTLQSIVDNRTHYNYATMSQNQFSVDGSLFLLPRSGATLTTGFVSEALSDNDGYFESNPYFIITLEAETVYYSLNLNFASVPPKKVMLTTLLDGVVQESLLLEQDFELENTIEHEFPKFDQMKVEFIQTTPNTRIFCDSLKFGDVTDYILDYDVMTSYPKGIQTEKISSLDIISSVYYEGDEVKNIFTEDVDLTDFDEYTFYFSEATHGVAIFDITDEENPVELDVIDSSSFYATVDVSGISDIRKITCDGIAYKVNEKVLRKDINTTGKNEEWQNPLISDETHADIVGDWLVNYFANNIEYDISYRGEPRVENGDIVFLENKYVNNLQIQIYDYNLDFNGALSGSIKAHRSVSMVDLTTSYLVDENDQRLKDEKNRYLVG